MSELNVPQSNLSLPKPKARSFALLVIDMDEHYPSGAKKGTWSSFFHTQALASLISTCSSCRVPVYFFTYLPGQQVLPVLSEQAPHSPVFLKPGRDAFSFSGLLPALRQDGADTLIVSGFAASDCVLKTARSAKEKGFSILTSPDALFTYIPDSFSAKTHLLHLSQEYSYHDGSLGTYRELGKLYDCGEHLENYLRQAVQ